MGMRGLQVREELVATMEGRANQHAGDDWYRRDLPHVSYNVCLQTLRGLLAQPSTLRSGRTSVGIVQSMIPKRICNLEPLVLSMCLLHSVPDVNTLNRWQTMSAAALSNLCWIAAIRLSIASLFNYDTNDFFSLSLIHI